MMASRIRLSFIVMLVFFVLLLSQVKSLHFDGVRAEESSRLLRQRETAENSPSPVTSLKPRTEDEDWRKCLKLAAERNECLPGQDCSTNFPNSTFIPSESSQPTTSPNKTVKDLRLPSSVVPDNYHLVLQPNMYDGNETDFNFNGSVRIFISCVERTNVIKIHTYKLNISVADVTVWLANGKVGTETKVPVNNVTYFKDFQWHEINLTDAIQPGKRYLLKIDQFSGPLKRGLFGLYLSSYKEGNTTRYLATSQLQPTHARKIFPCFDEPHLKATFNVTLIRRSHFHSLSNMPRAEERSLTGDWKADIFRPTLRMSTYLLGFVVSQFASMTKRDRKGRIFRVWARPDVINRANYSLQISVKAMNLFEKQFDLKYQVPKTDMVAVPDFFGAAMENWGIIIYHETYMLFDPLFGVDGNTYDITTTVAHEVAHMWFGNLVTLKWWDDLWLNEGFTTLMHVRMTGLIYPSWKMDLDFVLDMYRSMMKDAGGKPAVRTKLSSPKEILNHFDINIAYYKAAAILRMMEAFLGEDAFRRGLKIYLKRNQYGNTAPIDVWTAFSKVADRRKRPVVLREKMNPWINLKGYPVVTVIRQGKNLTLSQKQFVLFPYTSQHNSTWHIPLTWTTKSECNFSKTQTVTWMATRNEVIEVPSLRTNDWIIFNLQRKGYYLVNYDVSNWLLIAQQLRKNHSVIDARNRAQILHDAFSLAKAGLVPYTVALNLCTYLPFENEYVPVRIAVLMLKSIARYLKSDPYYGYYQKFIISLVIRNYMRLGWTKSPGEDRPTKSLRQASIINACTMQYKPCVDESVKLFREWRMNNSNQIPSYSKELVYCMAIRYGNEEDWNFLFRQMKTVKDSLEKHALMRALACTSEVWLINRYLMSSLDEKLIKKSDILGLIDTVTRNSFGLQLAFDFVRYYRDNITAPNRAGKSTYIHIVKLVVVRINNRDKLAEVEAFRDKLRSDGSNVTHLNKGIDTAKNKIKWMEANRDKIVQWLIQNVEHFKRILNKYQKATIYM